MCVRSDYGSDYDAGHFPDEWEVAANDIPVPA